MPFIRTRDGNKSIEEIRCGDYVLAQNPETGEKDYQEVVKTFVREADQIVHVVVGDVEIKTTREHPFYVEGKGFVGAGDLRSGDVLRLADGENATVWKVWAEALDEKVPVYNFEVAECHTYYVSELGVLVHNVCAVRETTVRRRNLSNVDEIDIDQIKRLRNNGIVKVNSSGSDRPLNSIPNSYYSTGNGEHVFVYDEKGRLIYDISEKRVKTFKINIDPKGIEHYQAYKLKGVVIESIKKKFGW